MTLIMLDQRVDHMVVVSDTVASHALDQPAGFSTKVWTIPHLNLGYAVSGPSALGYLLHYEFNDQVSPLQDVRDVNGVIPTALRKIHRTLESHHGPIGNAVVKVFGFPTGSEELVCAQYATECDDYAPMGDLTPGNRFTVTPWGGNSFELEAPGDLQGYIDLATRIRADNDQRIAVNPCAIGGELYLTLLRNWNVQTVRIHRFADYDEMRQRILNSTDDRMAEERPHR